MTDYTRVGKEMADRLFSILLFGHRRRYLIGDCLRVEFN